MSFHPLLFHFLSFDEGALAVEDAIKVRKKLGLLRVSCESDPEFYANKHFCS